MVGVRRGEGKQGKSLALVTGGGCCCWIRDRDIDRVCRAVGCASFPGIDVKGIHHARHVGETVRIETQDREDEKPTAIFLIVLTELSIDRK